MELKEVEQDKFVNVRGDTPHPEFFESETKRMVTRDSNANLVAVQKGVTEEGKLSKH